MLRIKNSKLGTLIIVTVFASALVLGTSISSIGEAFAQKKSTMIGMIVGKTIVRIDAKNISRNMETMTKIKTMVVTLHLRA